MEGTLFYIGHSDLMYVGIITLAGFLGAFYLARNLEWLVNSPQSPLDDIIKILFFLGTPAVTLGIMHTQGINIWQTVGSLGANVASLVLLAFLFCYGVVYVVKNSIWPEQLRPTETMQWLFMVNQEQPRYIRRILHMIIACQLAYVVYLIVLAIE